MPHHNPFLILIVQMIIIWMVIFIIYKIFYSVKISGKMFGNLVIFVQSHGYVIITKIEEIQARMRRDEESMYRPFVLWDFILVTSYF